MLPECPVLGGLITFEIWTRLSLYFCVVSVRVWSLLKVGLCTDSSPRKRCILARHLLIARTVQVWPHVSQNISGICIARATKMQANFGIDFSGAGYGAFVFFPLVVFPTISQTLAAEALAISMEAPMGNARDAVGERRLRRNGENAKVRAPRRRPSSVPVKASSVSRCAGAGHFFFSLFTQLRYEKNMRIVGLKGHSVRVIPAGWSYSWRVVRKVRDAEVASVGDCIMSVWGMQTGFRIS